MPVGPVIFRAIKESGNAVSEVELMQDDRILGERENLGPGLSGTFTPELEPGSYILYCPGATTERSTFTVTDAGGATGGPSSQLDEMLATIKRRFDTHQLALERLLGVAPGTLQLIDERTIHLWFDEVIVTDEGKENR